MRNFILLIAAASFFTACNNSTQTKRSFCDTTNCKPDSLVVKESIHFNPTASVYIDNCMPDSISWTHDRLENNRQIKVSEYINQPVKVNKSNMSIAITDTSDVWVAFNDCITGRGYLLKLPFRKGNGLQTLTGALNSFDPKFSLDPDLRAYTDRGSIYVVNVKTGKQEQMTFKENYKDMDFNDIHKVLDSIHVTKDRIYVKLLKNGQEVPFEKNVSL